MQRIEEQNMSLSGRYVEFDGSPIEWWTANTNENQYLFWKKKIPIKQYIDNKCHAHQNDEGNNLGIFHYHLDCDV